MADLIHQFRPLIIDIFRLCLWLVMLGAILVPLEVLFSARKKKIFRAGLGSDIAYYFLNNYLPRILMIAPLAVLGWILHFAVPPQVYAFSGALPLWVRVGAGLVLGEATYYWAHRWMHENPYLWRYHAVHHSAEEIDWLVSTRAHPLDIAFGHFIGIVPLYAFGLANPIGHTNDIAPLLFIIIGLAWSFFIHANLKWRFGWLERLVSTPAFHHWHHTRSDHIDRNYASMLPVMDVIFGTYYLPDHLPVEYGLSEPIASDMITQLVEPFAIKPGRARLPS